jgi:hypothetical protein
MLQSMLVTTVLVVVTVVLHYESLRGITLVLPRLPIMPRYRIIVVIILAFVGHTVEVWLFGLAYWILGGHFGLGSLQGDYDGSLTEAVYFSVVSYSTIGFGDVYPTGPLRLVAGVEGLTGLVMTGWTISFTYLAMQELWDMHPRRPPRGKPTE